MAGRGRPLKETEIELKEILELMLQHAIEGGFLCNLPAYIHRKTNKIVSLSHLDHIKDEHYLQTKTLAKAYCSEFWTQQAHLAGIPSAMWIFIQKNVAGWRDMKDVKIEANHQVETSELSEEQKKQKLESLKQQIAEKV